LFDNPRTNMLGRSTLWAPLVALVRLLLNRFAIYNFFTSLFISSNFSFNWSRAEAITSCEDNCPVVSIVKTNSSFEYSISTPNFPRIFSN